MPREAKDPRPLEERIHDEMVETVDEELEMEIEDHYRLPGKSAVADVTSKE